MTKRLHPPTQLLRAFVTTAQLGTISAAADTLHITQSAVSKQVQELEQWLGISLFARVRKRLQLTPPGQRYLLAVQPLLSQLEAATLDVMSSPIDGGVLHLSVLPTFGAKWLIPRLPAFQAAHPKVLLQFVPYVQGYDFTRADLDCAIRYGEGNWPGAVSEYVIGRDMTLIAPKPKPGDAPLKRPADIVHHRLLQHVSVPTAWVNWCERHQVAGVNPHSGIQLDQYVAIIRAVAAGMGLALVPTCLIEEELARGEVSSPRWSDAQYETAQAGYFFCYPENKAHLEPLVVLRRWLQTQTQKSEADSKLTD